MKFTLPLLALLLLAGCASVPLTDTAKDHEAKQFTPEAGKANIYINRDWFATALTLQIVLDGRIVGKLSPHTYQCLSIPAGYHVLAIGGETQNSAQSKFNAASGNNYFFNAGYSVGWMVERVHLDMVDEQTGRAELKDSKRAEVLDYETN